jgi:hypothetical protein
VRPALLLVLLALAAATAGCGGRSHTDSAGASFVPASVAAYVAIDTDPSSSQWRNADELSHRFPVRSNAVASLERGVRKSAGLDYETDVEPALGPEPDVVWLDLKDNGADAVGLMQPRDVAAFERAIAKGNSKDPAGRLVVERVAGWEVLADTRAKIRAFERALAAGGPVLTDDRSYRQAMHEYSSDAIVKAYVNGARVMDEVRAAVPPRDRSYLRRLGSLDWLASALSTRPDGVRLDLTVRGRAGKLLRSTGGGTGGFHLSLPKELPAGVPAYVGFHGASGAFSGLTSSPVLAGPQLRSVRSTLRRLDTLLAGENALYVRRGGGRVPEVTLVAQPAKGTDGMQTLDRILADAKLAPRIQGTVVDGVVARRLALGNGPTLVYGNVGDKLVVSDLPAGIAGVARPGSSLDGATPFRDAVDASGVPANVQSFLYVDVRGGLGLVERLANAPIPASVKRNLGPLRSAVEYAASRPSEVQVTLFVRIG